MFEFLAGKKHFTCFLVTIVTPEGIYQKIVDEKAFVIGRSPECPLSIPDPEISRAHLQVSCDKEQIIISDLGSSNKTFLNGEVIAAHNPQVIGPLDEIRLGKTQITLKFTLFEKLFKESFVKDSKLPDADKKSIMETLMGAHQEAKRIVLEAQAHQEKMMAAAQAKAEQMLEQFKKNAAKQIEMELAEMRKQATSALPGEVEKARQQALESLAQEKFRLEESLKAETEKCRAEMKEKVEQEKAQLQAAFADLKSQVEEAEVGKARAEKELEQLTKLKAENIESRKKELDEIYQNHLSQLEKDLTAKENETKARLEDEKSQAKKEVAASEGALSALKSEIEITRANKKSLSDDIETIQEKKKKLTEEFQAMQVQLSQSHKHLQEQANETQRLKTESGKLKLQIESDERRQKELDQDYQVKINDHKKSLDQEFIALRTEREKQFAEALKVDEEKIKKMKSGLLEELNQVQNTLIQDLHQRLAQTFGANFDREKLGVFSDSSMSDIKAVFDETLPKLSLETLKSDEMSVRISKRHRRQKYKWAAVSLTMGVLVTVGIQYGHNKLGNRSLASVMDEEQKQRDLEFEQRKFKPNQTLEVRSTYTDSVIYTKNFTQAYLDDEVQHRWLKAATQYLFEKWRIPEEKTIEVLAMSKTLVKSLEDKRQNINPDFVDQNIEKMRELETQTLDQMAEKLGTKVKLEAFKKLETKFFEREVIEKENSKIGN